jgi:cobalt-zinc-cadmium resistance protein CzcA
MAAIPGMHDVKLLRDFGQPNLDLSIDRKMAARFGINVADIQDAVQTAVGGNAVSQVLINEQRYNVVIRYQGQYRDTSKPSAIFACSPLPESGSRWRNSASWRSRTGPTTSTVKATAGISHYLQCERPGPGVHGRRRHQTDQRQGEAAARLPHWTGQVNMRVKSGLRRAWLSSFRSQFSLIFIILFTMFRSYKWSTADSAERRSGSHRRPACPGGYRNLPQRFVGHRHAGALWCLGADRSHHGGIHQPASREGPQYCRCRGRGRCVLRLRPIMMTMLVATLGLLAGGVVARYRIGLAAAIRNRHCRRPDLRSDPQHIPAAHILCMDRKGRRRSPESGGGA